MTPVTIAEFAKIKGVSATAVHKAISTGRLVNCLIRNSKYKHPRIDPVVAAQEWERNTDHNKRRQGSDIRLNPERQEPHERVQGGAVAPTAKNVAESYKARLLKLEYEKKAGQLIDAARVKGEWYKLVTEAKTKILSLPSKAKANLPHLTPADVAMIDRLCREALEDLASGRD